MADQYEGHKYLLIEITESSAAHFALAGRHDIEVEVRVPGHGVTVTGLVIGNAKHHRCGERLNQNDVVTRVKR